MYRYFFISFIFSFTIVFFSLAQEREIPSLVFDGSELHFSEAGNVLVLGNYMQGQVVVARINVKNDSDKVFLISNVRSGCGLSVPSWPRRPLKPGEEANIQLRYDSSRLGTIDKYLTIHSNTHSSTFVLKVRGDITLK